ncbi:cyclic nucleotide-binding domain-containing thioredoxin-disulfide reductase [Bradyrhizobium sp. 187]|jgi:thioredoxin reductase (NADPH)|uniref:FAD-dependent oxidoreductase n=1 Tax=Bradyrhizobium sp. 187 TaxID=2782655 RepID=UPI001FFE4B04|nr:cyclic nucleotide-binding domain-containing thioredoxin-disulfide reductase [Bradyrhizobium sp. 187]UPJ71292.1 FAD-dependent oxidoreductase [Bradyrhizobium sp. 187]
MDDLSNPVVAGLQTSGNSMLESRHEHMFPKFAPDEIDRMRRFGEIKHYDVNQYLFRTGESPAGMFVMISGRVSIEARNRPGRTEKILELGAGEIIAEVAQLSGGPALVDARATEPVEALLVLPARLRALLIADVQLGERIMRALILRRVFLIEAGAGGPCLIGHDGHPGMVRLLEFLTRNAYPHQVLDPTKDPDAQAFLKHYPCKSEELPLVVCPNGAILKNPSEADLGRALGMVPPDLEGRRYDVAIVGAGPGGLAAAVYAASEGLSVGVFDARAFGGQAGASSCIENYLGFPTGISGQALAGRAYVQAQKFGVEMIIPETATNLRCEHHPFAIELSDGRSVTALSVVIASGARYRRPNISNLEHFEGRGVWYWASPIEARLCRNEEVALVGGGNSAGQAAVFLSRYAKKVWMLVRGPSLSESMSQYLIDRIAATANIELLTCTEIVGLSGKEQGQLDRVRWRDKRTNAEVEKTIRNVFMFIGAEPATEWLSGCNVSRDSKGFVRTGTDIPPDDLLSADGASLPASLESNVVGVFAVGDVRFGSVKRVGAAIGEGATVVQQIHAFLETARTSRSGEPVQAAAA